MPDQNFIANGWRPARSGATDDISLLPTTVPSPGGSPTGSLFEGGTGPSAARSTTWVAHAAAKSGISRNNSERARMDRTPCRAG